jgi:hypothetical protein
MAKYRYTDRQETTAHGQVLGFAEWMWGPSLTYVGGVICEDGTRANWFKTAEPDTCFSVPGYVHRHGKRIAGFLTGSGQDEPYRFVAYKG